MLILFRNLFPICEKLDYTKNAILLIQDSYSKVVAAISQLLRMATTAHEFTTLFAEIKAKTF
jgi:hypothetical protein